MISVCGEICELMPGVSRKKVSQLYAETKIRAGAFGAELHLFDLMSALHNHLPEADLEARSLPQRAPLRPSEDSKQLPSERKARVYPPMKEILGVKELGGVDFCHSCGASLDILEVQTRGMDEGGTIFFKCSNKECNVKGMYHT